MFFPISILVLAAIDGPLSIVLFTFCLGLYRWLVLLSLHDFLIYTTVVLAFGLMVLLERAVTIMRTNKV